MRLSDEFLNELRMRCDIESVISQYVVLKKQGRRLTGLCPFHSEKTPSFSVSPDKQLFYCFGCSTGGDVITFIMKAENLSYPEAVAFLAQKVGLAVPENEVDDGAARLKNRIYEINRETARFFHAALLSPNGAAARDYIVARGLDKKTVTHFGLGYAPDSWDSLIRHLRSKGFKDAEMAAASVATRTRNGNFIDFFRNRLMFPIIDLRGNVVAFGGRKLSEKDNGPKYINSPETAVFVKNRNLYALNYAKSSSFNDELAKSGKERFFILCEGYMDVISLHQAGFDNAVAPLGTALTENQVRIMAKYVPEVIIATDSDEAGQKAAKRSFSLLDSAGLNTKIIRIQGAKDPDEYIKNNGVESFKKAVNEAMPSTEYQLFLSKSKYNLDVTEGKINFISEASEILGNIQDAVEVDAYVKKISDETEISTDAIYSEYKKKKKTFLNKQTKKPIDKNLYSENSGTTQMNISVNASMNAEKRLINLAVQNKKFCQAAMKILKPEDFSNEIYISLVKNIFENYEKGVLSEPAILLNNFDGNDLKIASEVFYNMEIYDNDEKTFEDLIISLKKEKLKKQIDEEKDPEKLKELFEEQMMLSRKQNIF